MRDFASVRKSSKGRLFCVSFGDKTGLMYNLTEVSRIPRIVSNILLNVPVVLRSNSTCSMDPVNNFPSTGVDTYISDRWTRVLEDHRKVIRNFV